WKLACFLAATCKLSGRKPRELQWENRFFILLVPIQESKGFKRERGMIKPIKRGRTVGSALWLLVCGPDTDVSCQGTKTPYPPPSKYANGGGVPFSFLVKSAFCCVGLVCVFYFPSPVIFRGFCLIMLP
ncbi:unnamed protein product, partial [Laminaria digitata]